MLYPVYVHMGDEKHAHGATVPDFPGCFSAADEWEELPRMAQEAAEVWIEGEDIAIPRPTPLQELAHNPEFAGGVWMLIDIDIEAPRPKRARRINITLAEDVLARIDAAARSQHETRSGYVAKLALGSGPRARTAAMPATKPVRRAKKKERSKPA